MDKLQFIGQLRKFTIQNYKFIIEVFPPEMIEISRLRRHCNL